MMSVFGTLYTKIISRTLTFWGKIKTVELNIFSVVKYFFVKQSPTKSTTKRKIGFSLTKNVQSVARH